MTSSKRSSHRRSNRLSGRGSRSSSRRSSQTDRDSRGGTEDVLRLSGPAALVSAAPYLVGFVPEQSLVLVALDGHLPRARVVGSARVDLVPDPAASLGGFARQAVGRGADSVMTLVYDDTVTGRPLRHAELIGRVDELMRQHGLRLLDALCVTSEGGAWRWWSYLCDDPVCCPPEGALVSRQAPIEAEAVGRGLVALSSRSDLLVELAPDEAAIAAVSAEIGRLPERHVRDDRWQHTEMLSLDAAVKAEAASLSTTANTEAGDADEAASDDGGQGAASPELLARHLLALDDMRVRDLVVVQPDVEAAEAAAQYWHRLVRCAPAELRAAPATLLAIACLQCGSGARANVALDVALAVSPRYHLAELVAMALGPNAMSADELIDGLQLVFADQRRRLSDRLNTP